MWFLGVSRISVTNLPISMFVDLACSWQWLWVKKQSFWQTYVFLLFSWEECPSKLTMLKSHKFIIQELCSRIMMTNLYKKVDHHKNRGNQVLDFERKKLGIQLTLNSVFKQILAQMDLKRVETLGNRSSKRLEIKSCQRALDWFIQWRNQEFTNKSKYHTFLQTLINKNSKRPELPWFTWERNDDHLSKLYVCKEWKCFKYSSNRFEFLMNEGLNSSKFIHEENWRKRPMFMNWFSKNTVILTWTQNKGANIKQIYWWN